MGLALLVGGMIRVADGKQPAKDADCYVALDADRHATPLAAATGF